MKKMAMVFLVLLIAVTACVAGYATKFNKLIPCDGVGDAYYEWLQGSWTSTGTGCVYVYHTTDGVGGHTNHFRVYVGSNTVASGNKWCTPGLNVRIACGDIYTGSKVKLKARGNTKYHTLACEEITVEGSYGRPLK
ncbi:MAG: hypothetical protein IJL36_04165 [Clostridia bacterium]|nr:hypothetical protein [Clostridia bacterium]